MTPIIHPLKEGTQVRATVKKCNCAGGGTQEMYGRIIKVYTIPTGIYYQLNNGISCKSDNVMEVL